VLRNCASLFANIRREFSMNYPKKAEDSLRPQERLVPSFPGEETGSPDAGTAHIAHNAHIRVRGDVTAI
jgi:hypothetical protein